MNNVGIIKSIALFFLLLVMNLAQGASSGEWERINMGGGGAMNIVGAGPTGTLVAGTDLAGAYIKRPSDAQWQMMGPLNGLLDTHVTGVAFDNSDNNIILLATEGGLYRSQNEGVSFTKVDRPTASSTNYHGGKYLTLAYQHSTVVPSGSRRVYASRVSQYNVADSRILRSDNGGQSFYFTAPLPNPNNNAITKIVIHPQDPDVLVVLSNDERFITPQNALYLSEDGGNSWTEIAQNISDIQDVVFHSVAPHYAFISSKPSFGSASISFSNLMSSSDVSTDSWYPVFTTPAYSNSFYEPVLMLWPEESDALTIRAINIATTWQFGAQSGWRLSFSSSWQNQSLGESSDWSGSQVNWNLGWSKNFSILSTTLESVNHTLGFDLSDSDRVLWATNQFVHSGRQVIQGGGYTLDFENLATTGSDTAGWSSTGLDNITPFILDVNAADPDVIYAGLNDLGCTVSRNAGVTWNLCIQNTGSWLEGFNFTTSYGGVTSALISDPANAARVWMFAAGDQSDPVTPLRSTNYGANWTPLSWGTSLPSTPNVFGLSIDPTSNVNQRRLYVTVDGAVYRSQNHGNSWSQVYACNSGCRITEVASDGTVYAGGEEGLFVSSDNGANWSRLLSKSKISGLNTGDVFVSGAWAGISGVAIDPNSPNNVYVAAFSASNTQGVYHCDVAGAVSVDNNCQRILNNTAYVRDVAVDPFNSQNLYATSSSAYTAGGYNSGSAGVLRSTDGGTSWVAFNDGLAWPMAIPIQVHPNNSNIVFVGSPGGGNYKINLSSPPVAATLVSPSGVIANNTPSYVWNAVIDASEYVLWVDDSTGNKIQKVYTAAAVGCGNGLGTCSVTPATALAGGAGQWRVQTRNSSGDGPWSAFLNFTVNATPIPLGPEGNVSNPTPTYTWSAVSNTTSYLLWVNNYTASGGVNGIVNELYTPSQAACTNGVCSVSPAAALSGGTVEWWVTANVSNGQSHLSNAGTFTVSATTPIPLSPEGNISDTTPTYTWSGVSNATSYLLWVNNYVASGGRNGIVNELYTPSQASCSNGVCSVSPEITLSGDSAEWWITANFANGQSHLSNAGSFTLSP